MNTKLLKGVCLTPLVSVLLAAPITANAQVDEIIVTAQKREQTLKDVPIAMTVVSAKMAERSGVEDIKDLIAVVPGLMVTSTSSNGSTTARIRGIGTVGDNTGLESSVGIVIDGVYRNRNGVGFNDLGEIEQIEVLRGPQGTLFGKNTSAGVISIRSKKPEYERSAGAELTLGNYGLQRISGHVTGGNEAETAAFRLFAVKSKRDGFLDVNTGAGPRTNDETNTSDYYSVRAQALFEPNDLFTARVIADYTNRDEDCCGGVQTFNGGRQALTDALAGGASVLTPANPEARLAFANRPTENDTQDGGISLEMNYAINDNLDLVSVTSYRVNDTFNNQDIDYTTADIWYSDNEGRANKFKTLSQELRLSGATDRLNWMVGGFFADESLERKDTITFGSAYEPYVGLLLSAGTNPAQVSTFVNLVGANIPGYTPLAYGQSFVSGNGRVDNFEHDAQTFAAFTHNTFAVTDRLEATLGARYTTEKKEVASTFQTDAPGCKVFETVFGNELNPAALGALAGVGPVVCLPWARSSYDGTHLQEETFDDWQGTAKLGYKVNDDITVYGGASRGFKSGGFNLDRNFTTDASGTLLTTPDTKFASEIITAYEIGANTVLANGALRLNANAFYQDIDGFQLNTFTGTSFVVNSIEKVTSAGAEADFMFKPEVDGLTFTGGVAYIDAKYGDDIAQTNLAGQQMTLSPKFNANLAASYETELSANVMGSFYLEGRYVSKYNTGSDLDVEKLQEGFAMLNGRVGLSFENLPFDVEFWGRNLTNKLYQQVAFDAPLQGADAFNAFLGAPRTYGLTLKGEF